jgi:DNA modification methylase
VIPTDLTPHLLQGNVLDVLRRFQDESVHCVVTSPPFWGLRRYDLCGCAQDYTRSPGSSEDGGAMPRLAVGPIHAKEPDPDCPWCGGTGKIAGMETTWGGDPSCDHEWTATPPWRPRGANDAPNSPLQQGNRGTAYDATGGKLCSKCGCWFGSLGLEPTPHLYVEHMVEVPRAVRRVLRDDGTVWMEIGDTYLTHPAGLTGAKRWKASGLRNRDQTGAEQAGSVDKRQPGIREGNLALIPHRVAIALQEDGWIVRQDNVWARPNPMPESVKNRSTRAHSYVFLLAKEPGYFYDGQAVRQPQTGNAHARGNGSVRKPLAEAGSGTRFNGSYNAAMVDQPSPEAGRNLLSVWTIPTQAFPGKHYATFPERIPEIAVLAGTSEQGACPECGAPFERIVGLGRPQRGWQRASGGDTNGEYSGQALKDYEGTGAEDASDVKRRILAGMVEKYTVGWAPTCSCYPDPCDRCGVPWERRTVVRKTSTFNVRVCDAMTGVLGFKSGLGGAIADASTKEVGTYEGGSSGSSSPYRYSEVLVAWPGCRCRPLVPPLVLDPFAGSGTTLAVAKRLGRRSVGIELSPYYVDMALRRATEARTETAHHPAQRRLAAFAEVAT